MEYSESGVAEPGCAFRTKIRTGEQWLLTRHEPPEAIGYTVWLKIAWMVLDIQLTDNGDGSTTLRWQRTFTAVRPLGRRALSQLTESTVLAEMETNHDKLASYLSR